MLLVETSTFVSVVVESSREETTGTSTGAVEVFGVVASETKSTLPDSPVDN